MYQVLIIARPADWKARGADDVPPSLAEPFEVFFESEDLGKAQGEAVAFNEDPARKADCRAAGIGLGRGCVHPWSTKWCR
jgi:hypothetical protein